ncbi:hypothetical protein RRG08_060213 [Elysia crispata]|uniref:Uncharacterized protein n=1 Tax=Elysia crispata TaxID=231223 RepID=A0AAE0YL90_9GAST|nr:hypothetical protein RRG08_060213 [Elysia crispata]
MEVRNSMWDKPPTLTGFFLARILTSFPLTNSDQLALLMRDFAESCAGIGNRLRPVNTRISYDTVQSKSDYQTGERWSENVLSRGWTLPQVHSSSNLNMVEFAPHPIPSVCLSI